MRRAKLRMSIAVVLVMLAALPVTRAISAIFDAATSADLERVTSGMKNTEVYKILGPPHGTPFLEPGIDWHLWDGRLNIHFCDDHVAKKTFEPQSKWDMWRERFSRKW